MKVKITCFVPRILLINFYFFLFVIYGFLICGLSSEAVSLTKNYTFSAATTAFATEVNSDFDQLFTEINSKETRITTLEGYFTWPITGTDLYYTAGKVGIGTNTPSTFLQVKAASTDNIQNTGRIMTHYYNTETVPRMTLGNGAVVAGRDGVNFGLEAWGTVAAAGAAIEIANARVMGFYTSNATALTERMRISANGRVAIANTAPGYQLDVTGGVNASGGYTSVSDLRLKTDIHDLKSVLKKVEALRAVYFRWKEKEKYGVDNNIGFIAQEVENIFPELVKTADSGIKSVNYPGMAVIAVEAVREFKEQLKETSKGSDRIEQKITSLEVKSKEIQDQIDLLEGYICSKDSSLVVCKK